MRGELSGEQTPIPETAATQREEQARRRRTNVPPVEDWQTVFMPHAHFYYPQVGDRVVYLMQGHEAYLGKYPEEGGTFLPATCDGRTFLVRRVEYRIGVHVRYALLTLVLLPENDDASKSAPSCPFPLPPCRIARARTYNPWQMPRHQPPWPVPLLRPHSQPQPFRWRLRASRRRW